MEAHRLKGRFLPADQRFQLRLRLRGGFALIAEQIHAHIPAALGAGGLKAIHGFIE